MTARNKVITPRNPAQHTYAQAIKTNDILFGIGPAGTGKTYLAMAMAVRVRILPGKPENLDNLVRALVESALTAPVEEATGNLPEDAPKEVH